MQNDPIENASSREVLTLMKENGVVQKGKVLDELEARAKIGIETYGTLLKTHNGRSAYQDLREELLDAVMYASQLGFERIEEGKNSEALFRSIIPSLLKILEKMDSSL